MNAIKKAIVFLSGVVLSSLSFAGDGVVIQFTVNEKSVSGDVSSSYTNAVLVGFNEVYSFDVEGMYQIKFSVHSEGNKALNIVTTLKDMDGGKLYYVGAKETEIVIGESSHIELERERV